MARHTNGFIVIDRKLKNSDLADDPVLLSLWIHLLLMANWKDSKTKVNLLEGTTIIKRGELVTSQLELMRKIASSRQKLRTRLAYLEKTGRINQRINQQGIHITIRNYCQYQDYEKVSNQRNNQRLTNDQPTDNQRITNDQPLNEPTLTREQENKETILPVASPTGGSVWNSYSLAYAKRYGTNPTRNAKSNALCLQLVKRIGQEDAPAVIEFYLTHNDRWYVQKCHALEYAVKDSEKLHMEWKRGCQMTSQTAISLERQGNNQQAAAIYWKQKYGE